MKQALVRNIDDDVIAAYRARARLNRTSLELELRKAIVKAAPLTQDEILRSIEDHQARLIESGFRIPFDFDVSAAIRWGRDDESET